LPAATIPEIQRSNLALIVLQFKSMKINDVGNFQFMDPPPKETINKAEKQLYRFGALNNIGHITDLGSRMVRFPVEPVLSKMLIASIDEQCSDEIITIISMMGIQNVFRRPKKKQREADLRKTQFESNVSDLITYLNCYKQWEANNYSSQWCFQNFINENGLKEAYDVREMILDRMQQNKTEVVSCGRNYERIQKAIAAGFAMNIAKRVISSSAFYDFGLAKGSSKPYQILDDPGKKVYIHSTSGLHSRVDDAW
jgi:ATP-dependent RNA helicase DHX8/PRP22